MTKSVILSIQPWYCSPILSGDKTVEVRKTKPRIQTPFKCYIYCTQCSPYNPAIPYNYKTGTSKYSTEHSTFFTSHVIGEFICDEVKQLDLDSVGVGFYEDDKFIYLSEYNDWDEKLTRQEFWDYSRGKRVYGWHISNLIIYDTPKKLSDFKKVCPNELYCESCAMFSEYSQSCGNAALTLKRPPQSWCYVSDKKRTKEETI